MPSTTKIRYHAEARRELLDAARRYGREDPALRRAFRSAVKRAEIAIADAPERWVQYLHGTRRYLLRRFPFSMVYLVEPDGTVWVVAVAHFKRKPGYWSERTEE